MSGFLRPEALATLRRWQEPAFGLLLILAGLWLFSGSGLFAWAGGGALAALGLGQLILGLRRQRFLRGTTAPGLIEIDEGRLVYLHPVMGGEISLNDLADLHLVALRGRAAWRLRDLQGRALLVPLDAGGAGLLFDALPSLPGLSSGGLIAALDRAAGPGGAAAESGLPVGALRETLVWRRPGSGLTPV